MGKNVQKPQNRVISYHMLRRAIGFIGILLPFVLWGGNALLNKIGLGTTGFWIKYKCNSYSNQSDLKSSISHFYYTTVGEIFTGALCAVALFLFCYRGYNKRPADKVKWVPGDSAMANIAGFCALGVVLFPTSAKPSITDNFRAFVSTDFTGYIHYGCAGLFFIVLSLISMVNFRRTYNPELFGKMKSHPIYLLCGIIMLVCMALVFSVFILGNAGYDTAWADTWCVTYILETVMLLAFGASWLIKGEIDRKVANRNFFGNGVPKAGVTATTPNLQDGTDDPDNSNNPNTTGNEN